MFIFSSSRRRNINSLKFVVLSAGAGLQSNSTATQTMIHYHIHQQNNNIKREISRHRI